MAKDPKDSTLGKKHTCFSCGCRFYDLGREERICPRCSANQKTARQEEGKAATRSARRPVEVEEEERETLPTPGDEIAYEEGDLAEDEFLDEDLSTGEEEIEGLEGSLQPEEEPYEEED